METQTFEPQLVARPLHLILDRGLGDREERLSVTVVRAFLDHCQPSLRAQLDRIGRAGDGTDGRIEPAQGGYIPRPCTSSVRVGYHPIRMLSVDYSSPWPLEDRRREATLLLAPAFSAAGSRTAERRRGHASTWLLRARDIGAPFQGLGRSWPPQLQVPAGVSAFPASPRSSPVRPDYGG